MLLVLVIKPLQPVEVVQISSEARLKRRFLRLDDEGIRITGWLRGLGAIFPLLLMRDSWLLGA